ncbi:DUF7706 family protein [Dasania marina]|uniref:DUF7706 family protein n=1 Tax=Dasania marina TaxID=471499 RepID=UPI0012EAC2FB|nr:hypothetical protein [Dasania marina]
MRKTNVIITANMTQEQALALALLLKRLGHSDFERHAEPCHPTQLEDMKNATAEISYGLSMIGFNPR